jgi:hypothetical protein
VLADDPRHVEDGLSVAVKDRGSQVSNILERKVSQRCCGVRASFQKLLSIHQVTAMRDMIHILASAFGVNLR